MRHLTKKHTLGKAQDQRDALLRALATELLTHGEIKTTLARAKALKPNVESLITLATGEVFETVEEGKKLPKQTVLRKLFCVIGKKYTDRNGGYTRIYHLPPRRGDASEMALIQLV